MTFVIQTIKIVNTPFGKNSHIINNIVSSFLLDKPLKYTCHLFEE